MKILLLGGCAEMAAPIIPRLLAEEDVELVTLGDLNEEKARRLAEAIPDLPPPAWTPLTALRLQS